MPKRPSELAELIRKSILRGATDDQIACGLEMSAKSVRRLRKQQQILPGIAGPKRRAVKTAWSVMLNFHPDEVHAIAIEMMLFAQQLKFLSTKGHRVDTPIASPRGEE